GEDVLEAVADIRKPERVRPAAVDEAVIDHSFEQHARRARPPPPGIPAAVRPVALRQPRLRRHDCGCGGGTLTRVRVLVGEGQLVFWFTLPGHPYGAVAGQ